MTSPATSVSAATPEPLTVVRIIDRLNVGGPAIHAVLTARGLDRSRFRTVLVVGSVEPGEADMSYLLENTDVEPIVIPSLGRELRPLRDLRTAWELYRLLRRERPDIVHTHKAKAGAIGRAMAILAGVPVRVHTYHGHVFQGYFGPLKQRAFIGIERALGRVTTRLVALSAGLVDELAERYRIAPRERFTVVPLGFDLSPFASDNLASLRGQLRREIGVGPDVPLVAIVGRMVPVKDHATFIASAELLARTRPDVHFVFVGGGELEQVVRDDVARRGLTNRMHLIGWQRDVARVYADVDVVALSSRNEGTPVALIEAMACGKPVVSTAVGGVPDLLDSGRRGELVPVGDPAALAAALERSLAQPAQARASAVRDEIWAAYSGKRLCDDLGTLYSSLHQASGAVRRPVH